MDNVLSQAFVKRLRGIGIAIELHQLMVGSIQQVYIQNWHLRWTIKQDERGTYIEYYGIHRMREHLHGRIYDTGEEEMLDVLKQYVAYSPNQIGDRERKVKEFEAYNNKLLKELRDKGLM